MKKLNEKFTMQNLWNLIANEDINNTVDSDGFTALSFAVSNGHEMLTQTLIRKGADPNQPDGNQKTPTVIALDKGFYRIQFALRGEEVPTYNNLFKSPSNTPQDENTLSKSTNNSEKKFQ